MPRKKMSPASAPSPKMTPTKPSASAPAMTPPKAAKTDSRSAALGSPSGGPVGPMVAGFQNNMTLLGLWSANQPLTAWVYVDTIGWRQLSNASDSVVAALNLLSSHAETDARLVSYNEDGGGLIDEMYVF